MSSCSGELWGCCAASPAATQQKAPAPACLGRAAPHTPAWTVRVRRARREGTERPWKFPGPSACIKHSASSRLQELCGRREALSLSRGKEKPLSSPDVTKASRSRGRRDDRAGEAAGLFQKKPPCAWRSPREGTALRVGRERQQVIALPSHSSPAITCHGAAGGFCRSLAAP